MKVGLLSNHIVDKEFADFDQQPRVRNQIQIQFDLRAREWGLLNISVDI